MKLHVIPHSIFLFVYFSGFRKQKPKVCEWLLHTQGTPVSVWSILATCLGELHAGKISFLPLRYPFLTNHKKSFMNGRVWGRGGYLKHPRFIFSSSPAQKIPRVEWYLISVQLSRLFVLRIVPLWLTWSSVLLDLSNNISLVVFICYIYSLNLTCDGTKVRVNGVIIVSCQILIFCVWSFEYSVPKIVIVVKIRSIIY